MSLSTIAAARQKEMKLSMAVVATTTLATGRVAPAGFVRRGLVVIWPPGAKKNSGTSVQVRT
jgi:hypothetical protein